MTCRHIVVFAQGPVHASWLAEDIPSGPRSPRTRLSSKAAYGPAPIIGPNLTPAGSPDIALLAWWRDELTAELALRRKAHREVCSVMADLREATNALLAMGEP